MTLRLAVVNVHPFAIIISLNGPLIAEGAMIFSFSELYQGKIIDVQLDYLFL